MFLLHCRLSYGSEIAVLVYDLSKMILENNGNGDSTSSKSTYKVGGYIRDMKISPDGQRIAVTFSGKTMLSLKFLNCDTN